MTVKSFEELVAWQKSKELVVAIYKTFRDSRDFGFRDQICRASVSTMNNIAEGYERFGNKEFVRFLFISKGSSGEVRSMLHAAKELDYINAKEYEDLLKISTDLSKLLAGLIRSMQ